MYCGWYWSKYYLYHSSELKISRKMNKITDFITCALYSLVILAKIAKTKTKVTFLYFWSFGWIRDLNDQTKHQLRALYPNTSFSLLFFLWIIFIGNCASITLKTENLKCSENLQPRTPELQFLKRCFLLELFKSYKI